MVGKVVRTFPMFYLIIFFWLSFLYSSFGFDFVRNTIGRSCPFVPAEWAVQS